ncbi:MAG: hypothetical protein GY815_12325 [Gammaproteobacteria bacterium]|nr:hypothetical protein [Gammaproteobacteria bacterium]
MKTIPCAIFAQIYEISGLNQSGSGIFSRRRRLISWLAWRNIRPQGKGPRQGTDTLQLYFTILLKAQIPGTEGAMVSY